MRVAPGARWSTPCLSETKGPAPAPTSRQHAQTRHRSQYSDEEIEPECGARTPEAALQLPGIAQSSPHHGECPAGAERVQMRRLGGLVGSPDNGSSETEF